MIKKIIVIILILINILFTFGCKGKEKIKLRLPVYNDNKIPSYVIEKFKLKLTEKGKLKMVLYADGAQIFELRKKAYLQNVKIEYFDKKNKITILTGKRAEINTDTNFIKIYKNVKLITPDKMKLYTDKLFWDDKRKKIYTDSFVTIIKGKNVLKGIGFESDVKLKKMTIKKRVKLKIKDLENER